MIRFAWNAKRRHLVETLADELDPPPVIGELLDAPLEFLLVPTRQAIDLQGWLGRVHAHYGIGTPRIFLEARQGLRRKLHLLDQHPGMFGHGTFSNQRQLPIACWELPDPPKHARRYSIEPGSGREGFLLQEPGHWISTTRTAVSAWSFEPMRHGPVRSAEEMTRPEFSFNSRREATREALRSAVAQEAAQAQVSED